MRMRSACLLLGAALALPAGAQNVVFNGDFKQSIGGWTKSSTTTLNAQWIGADARGALDSGSASVGNVNSSAGQTVGLTQCVNVTTSAKYQLSAQLRIPSGQGRTGSAYVQAVPFDGSNCTGRSLSGSKTVTLTTDTGPLDTWVAQLAGMTIPSNGLSVMLHLSVRKAEAAGLFQALFDDVAFTFLSVPTPRTITIPSSASIHGANATFFHTDVWVKNRSYDNAVTVTAAYHCQEGFTCADKTKSISLQPRETKLLADIVQSAFGLPETAGAIDLTYDSSVAEISATSRTYTPTTADPTNGTSVPSFPADDATTCATFLGLGHNGGDRSMGFRANAGAYNPGTTAATVTFRLVSAGGTVLGETTRTAQPKTPFQINDVFAAVGAGSTVTMNATLDVESTSPVFPFVTVIDNRSGDSVWVQPSPDEPR